MSLIPRSTPRFLAVCLALLGLAASSASAQVKADLLAVEKSAQPGKPLHVALRLRHDPHWHTYWINAGTGYPTTLTWTLPPGWTAGDVAWPVPNVIKDSEGNITGNGYEGEVLLPITLTPPAGAPVGQSVTLKVKADWLMCDPRGCHPGGATVELQEPVSVEPAAVDTSVTQALAATPMPAKAASGQVVATRKDGTITLTLKGGAPFADPHFFSEDGFVEYDQPQTAVAQSGDLVLSLPVSQSYDGDGKRLVGVLSYGSPRAGLAVDIAFTDPAAGPAAAPSKGLLPTLLLAFVGGMILNLMPCVFPVLGIKIMGFVNQAGADRRKVTMHGIVFTLGVLLSFWVLAGVLAALRAGGAGLGWGFQLQSAPFVFGLSVVMLVFALSLSGVFEFGMRATTVGAGLQMKDGLAGSFFTGILATLVATPCSAPFLAPALGAALALPIVQSFIVFTAIAIGLSTPYLLLSIFPGAVKHLPRPGAWMETFKQFMAFPLYATVGYLVWVLAGQVTDSQFLTCLLSLAGIAMGTWIYGRCNAPGASQKRATFGLVAGIAVVGAAYIMGSPRAAAPNDVKWEPWSQERVAELQKAGRPIYVDFTARWCATCQANKRLVFHDEEILNYLHDHNVATLRADWTNHDATIATELQKWGRSAVPFNLVYLPGKTSPEVLPELLTPSIVLKALETKAD